MVWFLKHLNSQGNSSIEILDQENLSCAEPKKLKGRLLRNLTLHDICAKGLVNFVDSFVFVYNCLFACVFVNLIRLSVGLSVHMFVCLCACVSACLSAYFCPFFAN